MHWINSNGPSVFNHGTQTTTLERIKKKKCCMYDCHIVFYTTLTVYTFWKVAPFVDPLSNINTRQYGEMADGISR